MLARFGVLLFPLFLYAILKPLKMIPEFLRIKRKGGDHAYSKFLFLIGFLVIMYVWAFFNVVLEGPHHSFHFWLVTGMILSFGRAGNFSQKYIRIRKAFSGS